MYFWKTEKLAEEIKQGTITQKEYKNYYLLSCVGFSIIFFFLNAFPNTNPSVPLELAGAIISLVIYFLWINKTYESNGGEQGKDFISRSAALFVPIGLKVMLLTLLFSLVAGITASILQMPPEYLESTLFNQGISVAALLISFWRLNEHLKYINNTSES